MIKFSKEMINKCSNQSMFGDQAERCEHVGISGGWADSEAALRIVREQQLQYHALVNDVK